MYWASKDNIVGDLQIKVKNYYQYLRTSPLTNLWQRTYNYYFKATLTGGDIGQMGENGEYQSLSANHFKNILDTLIGLTVSQRLTWQCRAVNTDSQSQIQAELGNGLLDYYHREKRVERQIKDAVRNCVAFSGEGFIYEKWDANSGDEYGTTETGAIVRNGDIVFRSPTSYDLIRDPYLKKFDDRSWLIIRTFRNKYQIAADFPEHAERIEGLQYDFQYLIDEANDFTFQWQTWASRNTDLIPVYEFYHEIDSALPNGRYVMFLQDDLVLIDSELPYDKIPVQRVSFGDIQDTPFGYTVSFDLLPLQKSLDRIMSTIETNQSAFGTQIMAIPRSANINPIEMEGMTILEYDGQTGPQPLNLLGTSPELVNFAQMLVQYSEMLSGMNSVVRGQPEASLKSGAALALVASQAMQSTMPLQASYTQLCEDVGTATINILKTYASVPRVAQIVGIGNRSYMKEFTGKDLDGISRVLVDVGNPLANSIAGRLELASNYMNIPPEYRDAWTQIVNTGRVENVTEGRSKELLLIKAENEKLQEGINPPVLVTDNHNLHIQENSLVLMSPEARENPMLVQATLDHLNEHIRQLKEGDPDLLAITGSTPIGQAPPPPANVPPMDLMNPTNPVIAAGQDVNLPNMPTNPLQG